MTAAARMQKIRVERHHDSPLKSSMKLRDERGELLVNAANLTEKDISPEFNSNLAVGKMFMISFERMRKCIAQIQIDFRDDINTWDAIQLDGLQLQIDTAKLALSLAHEVSVSIAKEVKLFHERASLQRTTIAYNISEHFMKASKLEKFFRDQYEAEKQEYFKLFGPSVLKANKQRLENDEMKAIQEQANQALQQLGGQIKELQDAEAQIIRGLK